MTEFGCANCRHLNRNSFMTCAAYPNGIPWPIMGGDVEHTKPLPDDNGIQFEPLELMKAESSNGKHHDPRR